MLSRVRNNLRLRWKQASAPRAAAMPQLSASEQTLSTWARQIESYADVPAVYQGFFEPVLGGGREFPFTLLIPAIEGIFFRTREVLLSEFGDGIHLLERSGCSYEARCYPFQGISSIEVRTILLDTRLNITGLTGSGAHESSTLRINTACSHLFAPLLERMRLASGGLPKAAHSPDAGVFDHWNSLNYKFMNYARGSLLGGDRVMHAILQPEIRSNQVTVLGRTFYRTIAPTLACILTERELILIREDIRLVGGYLYGCIWDYIPLGKIADIALNARDNRLLVLSLQLPGDTALEYQFQTAARTEIETLLDRFGELTA
jgi:hypothetical protein